MRCTVVRVDNGLPFIAEAMLEMNADGSVSFLLPNGQYAGQSPDGGYGVRADGPDPQQYQRATLNGSAVTFFPLEGWPLYVYLLGQGRVYPA